MVRVLLTESGHNLLSIDVSDEDLADARREQECRRQAARAHLSQALRPKRPGAQSIFAQQVQTQVRTLIGVASQ